MKTVINNGVILAWKNDRHEVLNNGVVVFEGNEIIYVGNNYTGDANNMLDAKGKLVIPGFVNTHLHVTDTPFTKGFLEDVRNTSTLAKSQNFALLYNVLPRVRHATDPDAQVVAAECAFAELALSGSTTVVELGYDFEIGGDGDLAITENVADVAAKIGLRCYSGPRYREGFYGQNEDGTLFYRNYPNLGRDRFEACIKFCREWDGKYDGLIRTMLAPGQIDTCDPDLLVETRRKATELNIPIQIHAGQSPNEFQRIKTTHNKTTVEYLSDTHMLGSDLIVGHGFWMSEDGNVDTMENHEIELLRESQTTICHLPWVKARAGAVINSVEKYKNHGIRQSLGTDTFPFDIFNDMRYTATCCKMVENNSGTGLSEDVFRMATIGGADALGRSDLGRLAPGCKADIVLVRIDTPKAVPIYDPFKFLVLAASGDDVSSVIVNGKMVVHDRKLLTTDVDEVVENMNEAAARVWNRLK